MWQKNVGPPRWPYALKWGHPLTRGLIWNPVHAGIYLFDLVTQSQLIVGNTTRYTYKHNDVFGRGVGGFVDNNDRMGSFPGSGVGSNSIDYAITTPMTMAVWAAEAAKSDGQRYLKTGNVVANYTGHILGVTATNKISVGHGDNTGAASGNRRSRTGSTTLTNAPALLAANFNVAGSDFPSIVLNGQNDDASTSGTGGTVAWDANAYPRCSASWQSSETNVIEGFVGPAYMWNRQLSVNEHQMLYEPDTRWSMYEEYGRKAYFFPAAAPAGGGRKNPLGWPLRGPMMGPMGA